MKIDENNYLLRLLGIVEDCNLCENSPKFNDLKMKLHLRHFVSTERIRSKLFCGFLSLSYILTITLSLVINSYNLDELTYILMFGFFLELLLYNLIKLFINKYEMYQRLKYLRYLTKYICLMLFVIFPKKSDKNTLLRILYSFLVYMNILFKYIMENNYTSLIGIIMLNSFVLVYAQNKFYLDSFYYFVPELIANLVLNISSFYIGRIEEVNYKNNLLTNYFNEQNGIYYKQLIENTDLLLICMDEKEVIYMNNSVINSLEKYFPDDDPLLINFNNRSNTFFKSNQEKLEKFLKNVQVYSPNLDLNIIKGKRLIKIIEELQL
jgi:hypothetical protein